MRVAITGSSGLIGGALVEDLRASGHTISRLVRREVSQGGPEPLIHWSPERGTIDAAALEGHDAVVHLAGEPIFGLWTANKKQKIRESRLRGTTLLARTIAGLKRPPSVLLSASAIGFYGDRPADEVVTEQSPPGAGFLAEVAQEWEAAAEPARAVCRVVHPRMGLVLTRRGGALQVMLPLFRAGLGGKLGSGKQMWSWVTLADVIGAMRHAIDSAAISGPMNVTAPNPVTNEEFTRVLARALNRPALFAVPAFAARLAMREMADEMLLSGVRAVPRKLEESGYAFRHPQLAVGLAEVLSKH